VYALRVRPALIEARKDRGVPGGNSGGEITGAGAAMAAGTERFFRGSWELWTGGLLEGLSGFVLTWTLFYGLVRA